MPSAWQLPTTLMETISLAPVIFVDDSERKSAPPAPAMHIRRPLDQRTKRSQGPQSYIAKAGLPARGQITTPPCSADQRGGRDRAPVQRVSTFRCRSGPFLAPPAHRPIK